MPELIVERSIQIAAPRERVWQAITDPKQIQQWFSPGTSWRVSASQVGGKLSVYDPETDTDSFVQIIDVWDPPQHLVTRTVAQPPEPPYITAWTLAEERGGTRLTLTYSGYELETEDIRQNKMEETAFGFGMLLENLQAFVDARGLPYPGGF